MPPDGSVCFGVSIANRASADGGLENQGADGNPRWSGLKAVEASADGGLENQGADGNPRWSGLKAIRASADAQR